MIVEARIPKHAKDLRIRHFSSLHVLPLEEGFKTDKERILFLSEFTGLGYNKTLQFPQMDVIKMSDAARNAIARMKVTGDPDAEIVLGKQTFCLVDPEKVGIGWHIDFANSPIAKDPVRLACLFYLPEGYNYSDVDENNNIIYPISSRYDLFAEEFPLELFIHAADFFLRKLHDSTKKQAMERIKSLPMRERINLLLRSSSGKRRSKQ